MFDKQNYIAVIKWKRGERSALKELEPKILSNIIPLIEVQPIPYNHEDKVFTKTIDQHLEDFGKNLSAFWTNNRPVFVDGYTLYDDHRILKNTSMINGMSPIEYVIEDIENQSIPAIPVTTLSRPSDYNISVRNCLSKFNHGLAIRIYIKDLKDNSRFLLELEKFIASLNISKNDVDIILDLAEINYDLKKDGPIFIDAKPINSYITEITNYISIFPELEKWRSFTILGTSVIDNFAEVPGSSNRELPRIEWLIYKEILKSNLIRTPLYGDYTVNSPGWFDFDPRYMPISANVKYTVENKYLVFKGVSTKSAGFAQIYALCNSVIKHPEYCGRSYSAGDEFIFQCGTWISPSTGNQETWIKNWVNHHLTLVSNCLTNLHANVTS